MFEGGASASVLEGLFEMRLIIEPAMARLAAKRPTLDHIGEIRKSLQTMEKFTLGRIKVRPLTGASMRLYFKPQVPAARKPG